MSRNYYFCCPETKEAIWIGQGENGTGYMDTFYSAEEKTMDNLIIFLNKNKGKNLILIDEHNEDLDKYFIRKFKVLGINVSLSTKKEVNQV